MNPNFSLQSQWHPAEAAGETRAIGKLPMIGVSMAPIILIVCVVALVLSLAVAAFLLGGQ